MMNEVKKPLFTRDNILTAIFIIGVLSLSYYGLTLISTSDNVERILMEKIDNTNYRCVIEQGVPENKYTGEIRSLHIGFVGIVTTHELTEDAQKRLYDHWQSKLQELPCYDIWWESQNNSTGINDV